MILLFNIIWKLVAVREKIPNSLSTIDIRASHRKRYTVYLWIAFFPAIPGWKNQVWNKIWRTYRYLLHPSHFWIYGISQRHELAVEEIQEYFDEGDKNNVPIIISIKCRKAKSYR